MEVILYKKLTEDMNIYIFSFNASERNISTPKNTNCQCNFVVLTKLGKY